MDENIKKYSKLTKEEMTHLGIFTKEKYSLNFLIFKLPIFYPIFKFF